MISNSLLLTIVCFAILIAAGIIFFLVVAFLSKIFGSCFYHPKPEDYYSKDAEAAEDNAGCFIIIILAPLLVLFIYWLFTYVLFPPELANSVKDFVNSIFFAKVK